jgi:hypothetical protein
VLSGPIIAWFADQFLRRALALDAAPAPVG